MLRTFEEGQCKSGLRIYLVKIASVAEKFTEKPPQMGLRRIKAVLM